MKQSVDNNGQPAAQVTRPPQYPMPKEGPTKQPQERLLDGKLVGFANAEDKPVGNPGPHDYKFEE